MNSRSHLPSSSSINKTEKLHFLKSKQRMPILKESRANNNSRLGFEPADKEHHGASGGANSSLSKTYAQMTQRNRSQTRLEEKNDGGSEKQNSGSATVPAAGHLGRKKQTW